MKRLILFCKDFDPSAAFSASLEVVSYMSSRSEAHTVDGPSLEFRGPKGRRVRFTYSPDTTGSFCNVEIDDPEIGDEDALAYVIKTIYAKCGLSEVIPS